MLVLPASSHFFRFLKHLVPISVLCWSCFLPTNLPTVFHNKVLHQELSPFNYQLYSYIFVICFPIWFIIDIKYFTSILIISQLFVKWAVWSCAFMSRKCETWFWFWKLTKCFVGIKTATMMKRIEFFWYTRSETIKCLINGE